ncbi:MAG: hypothetical protein RLZZ435_10 [Cyanobacteriota bacterium]|jgi:hypothetical protein
MSGHILTMPLHSIVKNKKQSPVLDALHIACAESQQVDRFVTCDDRLIKRYKNGVIHLCNPVEFVLDLDVSSTLSNKA